MDNPIGAYVLTNSNKGYVLTPCKKIQKLWKRFVASLAYNY
jgi:hypothetical protein